MFEKLSDNLNHLMTEAHISADELARRTGVPSSTIKKIRNRYNPNPTLATLLPLTQFFKITLGQLVGDEPIDASRVKGLYQPNANEMLHIPIITWKDSISWPLTHDQLQGSITTEYNYSKNSFALIVEEADWENLVKGTVLLVDPLLKVEHRDFIIVHKIGHNIPTLKQVLFDEGQIYIKPVIRGYNIVILTDQHKILGVVVEYKKNLKMNHFDKI